MRILFVTCHVPFPPFSGGRRREYELLRRVARDAEVDVVAVTKNYDEDLAGAAALFDFVEEVAVFRAHPVEPRGAAPQVARHTSLEAAAHIAAAIRSDRYDAVHCEGYYLTPLIRPSLAPPLVLGTQNVEYELFAQRGMHSEAGATRAAEVAAWRRSAVCTTVTEEDRAAVRRGAPAVPVFTVPDGADHSSAFDLDGRGSAAFARPNPNDVLLPGNFAYEPTFDGARRFLTEVFPRLIELAPDARVLAVGNESDARLAPFTGARVRATGRVEAIEPYLANAHVVACPLWAGGGVKVKVLEAVASGSAVVTTSVGAQGMPPGVRDALRIVDEPAAFASSIATLLTDAAARQRQEGATRSARCELATWDESAQRMLGVWTAAAQRSTVAPPPAGIGRAVGLAATLG